MKKLSPTYLKKVRDLISSDPMKALAMLSQVEFQKADDPEGTDLDTVNPAYLKKLLNRLVQEIDSQVQDDSGNTEQDIPTLLKQDFEIGLQKLYAWSENIPDADDFVDEIILLKYQVESGAQNDLEAASNKAIQIFQELKSFEPTQIQDVEDGKQKKDIGDYDLPDEIVASVKNLNFSYPGSDFSIQNINAEFKLGQISGIVGRNGNGKTTFFKLLTGEIAAQSGSIEFPHLHKENQHTDWTKVKALTSYVPQELPEWRGTLQGNLHLEAAHRGLVGKDNVRAVEYIIHRLGLIPHLNKKWSDLSGGYKMRFALAKALVWYPKFLVIDEPLANLDIEAQARFLNDIRHMSRNLKNPISVVLSSQHLFEIEAVADQLLMLEQGKVVYIGHVDGVGKSRETNIFEFSTPLDFQTLEARLNRFNYVKLERRGLNYIIQTNLKQGPTSLLDYAIRNQITLNYFRDISRSVKQYFL